MAELNLLQIAGAERLFLCGLRDIERYVHPFVGQGESGLADHEMLARFEFEAGGRLATNKDWIAGRCQPVDSQPRAIPTDLGMIAADAIIPSGRPAGRAAAEYYRSTSQQRSPPAVLGIDSLRDQVGHCSDAPHSRLLKTQSCLVHNQGLSATPIATILVRSLASSLGRSGPEDADHETPHGGRDRRDHQHGQTARCPRRCAADCPACCQWRGRKVLAR